VDDVAARVRWCAECNDRTQVITKPICPICGQTQHLDAICGAARSAAALCSFALVVYVWWRCAHAIHRLKYRRDVGLGEALAQPMIQCLQAQAWPVDLVTPVPLGLARLAERGYNQAALLARPIALFLGLVYCPMVVQRARETRSQVGLSAAARRDNVVGAFRALSERASGKRILIVDDVTTSGATLNACAQALMEAGAECVYGLTLARAGLAYAENSEAV
jgi:ComF family protein